MKPRKTITKKYLDSWKALYAPEGEKSFDGRTSIALAKKPSRKAPIRPEVQSEQMEQVRFVRIVKQMGLPIMSIPNGARRSLRGGAAQKAAGLMSGAPDIFIPVPTKSRHGLFVEMKRSRYGVVSQLQKECIEMLNRYGYTAEVAAGCDAAVKILENYLRDM